MEKIWVLIIAIVLFCILNLVFWKTLRGYFKKEAGKRTWKMDGKVYFWQGSIFVSTLGTLLFMYILKWSQVLTF